MQNTQNYQNLRIKNFKFILLTKKLQKQRAYLTSKHIISKGNLQICCTGNSREKLSHFVTFNSKAAQEEVKGN